MPLRYAPGMRIPGADLRAQYAPLRDDLLDSFARLLDSGQFILGPDVSSFEQEFAAYCEARHAIGVGNGTDALVLALRALDIGPGDLVAVPDFTFAATIEAVCLVGARPVLIDIEPSTFNLSVPALAAAVQAHGKQLRAILPVHLYGRPAPIDEVIALAKSVGAAVVEDAAQAHGARYQGRRTGALGNIACFSFYPTKNLGAAGDGGAITTNDDDLAAKVRLLRDHGQSAKYVHSTVGYNSRLDTLQAIVLRAKLPRLDAGNQRRREIARLYAQQLDGVTAVTLPATTTAGDEHVHHLFVVRCRERDALQQHLTDAGIATSIHYPRALHEQPAFAAYADGATFPAATTAAHEVLALPCYPELGDAAVAAVSDAIRSFYIGTASA